MPPRVCACMRACACVRARIYRARAYMANAPMLNYIMRVLICPKPYAMTHISRTHVLYNARARTYAYKATIFVAFRRFLSLCDIFCH
jgi:hypothetical protein